MRRAVLLAVLLAACGGATVATTTTVAATTTTPQTTSTSPSVETTTSAPMRDVRVFFGTPNSADCADVAAYGRRVPDDDSVIRSTFEALLAGPTDDEKSTGATSFFGVETIGYLAGVELVNGALAVDFTDFSRVIPNASSSCGSAQLLAELTSTAMQFSDVTSVTYTFDGSCEAFGAFLQMGCVSFDRSSWPPITITTTTTRYGTNDPDITLPPPLSQTSDASGSGCDPGSGDLPDGIWAGFVRAIGTDSIDFDLVCFFVGDAANAAATHDGAEEVPVPNDYYIRNENPTVRQVAFAGDATVYVLTEVQLSPEPWETWVADPDSGLQCPGDDCLVWIYVNTGVITEAVEQYRP